MGGDIPADTKLPDDVLEKRLREAINASQNKATFSSLDLGSLQKWPMATAGELDTRARPLVRAMQRGSIDEAQRLLFSSGNRVLDAGATPGASPSANPFIGLREVVAAIGGLLDDGGTWCVVQSEDESSSIGIRVVSVLEIHEDTPVIVVLYRPFNRSSAKDCAQWISEQSKSNAPALGNGFIHIKRPSIEVKLLLLYLKLNASLVPADFPVDKKPNEARFKPSVLLPVAPLDFDALAKIAHNLGCSVCGKKGASRCAQCQTVWYCGAECQRADWPDHKQSCKSLKGGRWVPITFQEQLPLPSIPGVDPKQTKYMSNINKFSSDFSGRSTATRKFEAADPPPPNVWGDRVFMIKLQVALSYGEPGHMMLYDRKRSFQGFMLRKDNPAFAELYAEMLGPRGGFGGMKMYRWAKRTGDWELSVCLDRQPQTDTKW
ncbi:hypothetical protein K466DRAFT_592002 [Polyporus arcularius HHB13444]|uniref:MYND-type domain-containing protein n=1 Tax=Polyporus arcularius HHB13444 TaxID=1314778 RepID=A0A5C3NV05_9APHY|nr:hypothetical protein K466DRAFT_592002 [Polyporus arcularius HHB13444]